ncbi:MAG TPA: putative glycolipid-binding domain-containing protein, partial [Thermoanaerobaculia bacterium]|nr:putative glycolipid-binding domain-containing protein [Thermoanaerobaculia bacterium]
EPLEQTYRRTGESLYRYESAGGRFTAELAVDADGFPIHYPGFAERVAPRG